MYRRRRRRPDHPTNLGANKAYTLIASYLDGGAGAGARGGARGPPERVRATRGAAKNPEDCTMAPHKGAGSTCDPISRGPIRARGPSSRAGRALSQRPGFCCPMAPYDLCDVSLTFYDTRSFK
ncbi:hypothetical protein EVAR_90066_1 [Eumeta japonica]|uniref:Uncharacterized protein n=1 Tax=Eumeta variegata TaxID=151549 RepID=A0A4C2A618_EUMVA|nr:hypothetical protein EVAR_90066_1 [Eumeta japonica]